MIRQTEEKKAAVSKQELFATMPVPKALRTMAVPTIISQLINLIYGMVDAVFIGRTGNSYMMAAISLTLTLLMLNAALSNLFGIGGGSLVSRLMGTDQPDEAKKVSAFSLYGTIVIGGLPAILSAVLAHLLRNAGFSSQASIGLSGGGILNVILDPLFMFVLLPKGQEVTGAALATALSNTIACGYLLYAYRKASRVAPMSMSWKQALATSKANRKTVFTVGIPSAILTGLFDLANVCVNIIASAHSDLVLAGMGIVMKVERFPNAINVGLCQGMLPIVAFNYSSGNHDRMRETIRTARIAGLTISAVCIVTLELLAGPAVRLFLNTNTGNAETALKTVAYAALFLRIRAIASPVQFINYHTSFSMQAMGEGRKTLLHAFVRELVFYIPFMFLLDHLFGETGLAAALPVGEGCGAIFALFLLGTIIRRQQWKKSGGKPSFQT